jgi:predicted lipase
VTYFFRIDGCGSNTEVLHLGFDQLLDDLGDDVVKDLLDWLGLSFPISSLAGSDLVDIDLLVITIQVDIVLSPHAERSLGGFRAVDFGSFGPVSARFV